MSSDKDSVAPEKIRVIIRHGKDDWIGIAYSASAPNSDKIHEYVRDDGDLISRSTVVKRLTEVRRKHTVETEGAYPYLVAVVQELIDGFEAADKDKNSV